LSDLELTSLSANVGYSYSTWQTGKIIKNGLRVFERGETLYLSLSQSSEILLQS